MTMKTCDLCKKEFLPRENNKNRQHYCSKECSAVVRRETARQYYLNNRDKVLRYHRAHYKENRPQIYAHIRARLASDTNYRLSRFLRARLRLAIRNNQKSGSAVGDLGCSVAQLKRHLEKQFSDGMSWKNYGHKGWHIDHVVPLSLFDLTNREQFLTAVHYTNLQPLWAGENYQKRATLHHVYHR